MTSVVFRLCDKAPDILREVCLERGWEEYCEDECETDGAWNLWWKTQGFTLSEYETCRPWQRLNHFPKSSNITKKDGLARNLRRLKTSYGGSMFDFFPQTFILPNEYKKFVAEFSKQEGDKKGSNYWICKPTEQSCGRGIFIFQDLHDFTYDCAVVVQKYIIKPLLISGYKFDLRLYAIVTSYHPFHLYIYHEGIVRFSTERFDLSSLNNRFSHLTNTSINKTGPQYLAEKESIGIGCKWTLSQLRVYLHKHNFDDRMLWHRITTIIILTLLSQVQDIPDDTSNCFEMFGFDILVDENMKPWLLEVNFSPALGNDCSQDDIVKRPLLNDILEILNFSETDIKRGGKDNDNVVNSKKSFKKRCVKHRTLKSIHKPILSNQAVEESSKTIFNMSAGKGESDLKINNSLGEKGPVFGRNEEKRRKSFRTYQKPSSKLKLSSSKRNCSSEEFLMASVENCDSSLKLNSAMEELKEKEVHLEYSSKEVECGLDKPTKDISKEGKKQTFSGKATEDENKDLIEICCEGGEKARRVPNQARSQRQTLASTNLSIPEQNRHEQGCNLCVHCYKSDMSFIYSMKTFDDNALHYSSMETLGDSCLQLSSKLPRELQRSKKGTCATLKPQIGNCILAFPFNHVTFKICQGRLDLKVVIGEMRKILKAISTEIKSQSSNVCSNSTVLDLSQPYWGFRSSLNAFYSILQLKAGEVSPDTVRNK